MNPTGNERSHARALLASGARAGSDVSRATLWYSRYALVFAVLSVVAVLCLALPAPLGPTISTLLWVLGLAGLSAFAERQQTTPPGFRSKHRTMLAIWLIAYALVLVVGLVNFPGSVTYWLVAGLITAVPPVVTSALVRRGAR